MMNSIDTKCAIHSRDIGSPQDKHIGLVKPDQLNEDQLARLERLKLAFRDRFQDEAHYVVCAPGRVNLIGDHIDYHGFPVLPMAIERSIWLACSFGSSPGGLIRLENLDAQKHTAWVGCHSFEYAANLSKIHSWHNYFLCGYHGLLASRLLNIDRADLVHHARELSKNPAELAIANRRLEKLPALNVLVDSNLPEASGLSSSSALVCGSAVVSSLLFLSLSTKPIILDARDLADECARFEHLIGTCGGGMDQAIIMTAEKGYAKYVEFVPELKCQNVRLPERVVWIISHSGISFEKAVTIEFNKRVLETKFGAALIAKLTKNESQLHETIAIDRTITLGLCKLHFFPDWSASRIVEYLQKEIFSNRSVFTLNDIALKLELTRSELVQRFDIAEIFVTEDTKFELASRCEHVFEEAERTDRFKSICRNTVDTNLLGQLMTQSHSSLKDKYACSHPALDRIITVALEAGALGSRMTGAGWGGCVLSLVEESKCRTVLDRLSEVSCFNLRTEPSSGISILNF